MSWEVENIKPLGSKVWMDVRIRPWWGWVYRWVFRKDSSYTKSFYGSCTVWYDLADGSRCGSFTEAVLADFYSNYQFEQELARGLSRNKSS